MFARGLATLAILMFAVPAAAQIEGPLSSLEDPGPTTAARAELVVGQTLHGFAQGMASCNLGGGECPDGTTSPLAGLVGAGMGGGASFLLSWKGVRAGQALAINAGTLWGAGEGIFLSTALQPDQNPSTAAMIGMGLGTATGVLLALTVVPSAAQVAFIDTATFWIGTASFFDLLIAGASGQQIGLGELIALNVALAGSTVAGLFVRMSRGRLFLIDAGGLVGLLAGIAGAAALSTDSPRTSAIIPISSVSAGTVVGLAWATYLTRAWDGALPTPKVTVLLGSGARPGLSVAGAF
jgi:hypothetical protein